MVVNVFVIIHVMDDSNFSLIFMLERNRGKCFCQVSALNSQFD